MAQQQHPNLRPAPIPVFRPHLMPAAEVMTAHGENEDRRPVDMTNAERGASRWPQGFGHPDQGAPHLRSNAAQQSPVTPLPCE